MTLPVGIVVLEDGPGPAAERLATGAGRWARLGDRLLVWGDEVEAARAAGSEVQDAGEVLRVRELRVVTQVGRLFQLDHPDVPVLVDKGRFLVVRLDDEQARRIVEREEVCYGIAPLKAGMVVFEPFSPEARAPEPWIQTLVSRVARSSYEEALTYLANFPTRHSLSSHYEAAALWAQDELRRFGYTTRTEPIMIGSATSRNVVAERRGLGPTPRNLVVVTAHLDSVNHPAGGGPSVPAPGADDNGSGAAGVLEIARVLAAHKAEHDLRFILFGGEEQGLFGSRQYVAALPASDRARMRTVVNMDMVASRNLPERTVLLEGATVSQGVMDALGTAAATYTSLAVQRSLNPFASDHVPFINAGLPAVLTIEGADSANGNIHTAGDTLVHIDYDLALEILRLNVATAAAALSIQHAAGPVASPTFAVAWGPGRLDVVGRGIDSGLHHQAWDGSQWVPGGGAWEGLGGLFSSEPRIVAWGPGRLDVLGLGTDSGMYHKAWDGSQWVPGGGGWEGLGGLFVSPPAVVAWDSGRLDVFGLGTDNGMYHKAWDGSQWVPGGGGWEGLGGIFTRAPAVAAWGPNRLDVFGIGLDSGMYHQAWDGSQWVPGGGAWEGLGGLFVSPPAVAAWDAGRLDVFGLGTDSGMYHKAWDGTQWVPGGGAWEGLGGTFRSPPAVVAWDANRLDVFGLGLDNAMYHKAWDGSQWVPAGGNWERLGGIFQSQPAVVAWAPGRLDVFGLGLDFAMYHKAWDGSQWVPGGDAWERLGGIFSAP